MKKLKNSTLILLAIFISSCSPQKRLDRLYKNNPYLIEKQKDTIEVTKTDTIITESVKLDTLIVNVKDTVRIEKERLKVQLKYINDTLYFSGECEADTIVLNDTIKVEIDRNIVNVNEKKGSKNWIAVIFVAVALTLIFFVNKFVK